MGSSEARTEVRMPGAMAGSERKITPDLARGFMLALIAMAYSSMYLVGDDIGGYGVPPGGGVADQAVSFMATLFLENRAFPLFAILFGYGMVMLTRRQRDAGTPESDIRRLLRRRSLWLLVLGMVHALFVFPGEILAAYGVGTLILGWLLFRSDKAIQRTAAILVPIYLITTTLGMLATTTANREAQGFVPGYVTAFDWIERAFAAPLSLLMNVAAFPLLLLMVVGMWVGRRGLLEDPSAHRTTLVRLAASGIAVSVLGALPLALTGAGVFATTVSGYGYLMALQVLTGIFGGVGYAAAFALIGIRMERRRGLITRALVAAGQRSLSVYLFASIGIACVLHPDLIGLGEHVHRAGAVTIGLGIWVVGVLLALALDIAGKPGPADTLLRRLVYREAR